MALLACTAPHRFPKKWSADSLPLVMNSVRSAKAHCIIAFIFGALIALLVVSPARSEETSVATAASFLTPVLGHDNTLEFSGAL